MSLTQLMNFMLNEILRLQYESRAFILKAIHNANSSHVGSALSCIDILIAQMLFLKKTKKLSEIDCLKHIILSKGHAAAAFYGILNAIGENDIDYKKYYQNGSWLTGHVSHKINGISHSTGSLGHVLPVVCGMAYANPNSLFSVLLSDGEMQEGSNWEALMVAPILGLKNISIVIDYNNQQSFGKVTETMSIEPLSLKLESFGWHVEQGDGHNVESIYKSLLKSIKYDKPFAYIANTTKGKGVSFMEDKTKWHYSAPNDEELEIALEEIKNKYR